MKVGQVSCTSAGTSSQRCTKLLPRCQALTTEHVDQRQHSQPSSIVSPAEHEVVAPDIATTLRTILNARGIIDAAAVVDMSVAVEALSAVHDAIYW